LIHYERIEEADYKRSRYSLMILKISKIDTWKKKQKLEKENEVLSQQKNHILWKENI